MILASQNFRITPALKPKVEKCFITFMGFDGTDPLMFRLRTKTKEGESHLTICAMLFHAYWAMVVLTEVEAFGEALEKAAQAP